LPDFKTVKTVDYDRSGNASLPCVLSYTEEHHWWRRSHGQQALEFQRQVNVSATARWFCPIRVVETGWGTGRGVLLWCYVS